MDISITIGPEAGHIFRDLGRWIAVATSEPLSHQYLLQWVFVAIQHGNAVAILGTLLLSASSMILSHFLHILISYVFSMFAAIKMAAANCVG